MPIFYRGAAIGTYWHCHDARKTGFTSQSPGMQTNTNRLTNHIARGTVASPFISLTRSYGVAWSYAVFLSRTQPKRSRPAYVYEIEFDDPPPLGLLLLDPIKEVANALPPPLSQTSYHHDGVQTFLLGVVDPDSMKQFLTTPIVQPPPRGGTQRPANLSIELETLVRALRDAEILAVGTIPASCVRNRYAEY